MEKLFERSSVSNLYREVRDDLESEFDVVYASEKHPLFVLPGEDVEIRIVVAPASGGQTDHGAVVRVVAWFARDINSFAPGVMRFLLEETAELVFGRYGIDHDGDIFVDAVLHSEGYTADMLFLAIATVYTAALNAERHLEMVFGGAQKPN